MGLLFGNDKLVKKGKYLFVDDSNKSVKMRLAADLRVIYSAEWPNRPGCTFNLVWKPNGGGKRDSQLLFLNLLRFQVAQRPRDAILYVDADTSFRYKDVQALHTALLKKPSCGAACGEIRVRNNHSSLLAYAQSYEYLVNHMLGKASESWFRMVHNSHIAAVLIAIRSSFLQVLCCPGAWTMYRVEAVEQVMIEYSRAPKNIREYHRLEQGEDRYQDTLTLKRGWHTRMVKTSVALTQAPKTLIRLTEQRRRWNNSTLENSIMVLGLRRLWRLAPVYMV